jgi:MFS family permease
VVSLAFFTDNLVYAMLPPLLPEYSRLYGLSQTSLGMLFGSYAVTLLLAPLPMGAWTDRMGRRGPFLGALLGFSAATVLFAFANSFPMLLLARLLQGAAGAATWVTGMAILAAHFPAGRRGKAMSAAFACNNLGLLTGPAFAGWMVKAWSIRAAFLAVAGLAVLDALARMTLLPQDPPTPAIRASFLGLLRRGTVLVFTGAMAMGAMLASGFEAVLPLRFSRHLGMDSAAIGLAFTTAALAIMGTSPLVGHWTDRRGGFGPVRMGLILAVGLLLLAPFLHARVATFPFMFATGAACSLIMSPTGAALAGYLDGTGEAAYGAVFSLVNMAFALGIMVGPVLVSSLEDMLGLQWALALLAAGFALYLVPVIRLGRPVVKS